MTKKQREFRNKLTELLLVSPKTSYLFAIALVGKTEYGTYLNKFKQQAKSSQLVVDGIGLNKYHAGMFERFISLWEEYTKKGADPSEIITIMRIVHDKLWLKVLKAIPRYHRQLHEYYIIASSNIILQTID